MRVRTSGASSRRPTPVTSTTTTAWSPVSTVSTSLQSAQAGAWLRTGAPEGAGWKGKRFSLTTKSAPSTAASPKKAKARSPWPLPRKDMAMAPPALMLERLRESFFTPRARRGGSKDIWETQLIVPVPVSSPVLVRT